LSILAPCYLGTPLKARDKLAENSRNFAFYESALLRKLYKHISSWVTATSWLHHSAATVIVCHFSISAKLLLPASYVTALLPSSCVISTHQRGHCYQPAPSQRCRCHRASYQHISSWVTGTGWLHHTAAAVIVHHISTPARSLLPASSIIALLLSSCIVSAHQRGRSLLLASCVTALLPSLSIVSAHQQGHCYRLAASQRCCCHNASYQQSSSCGSLLLRLCHSGTFFF
jgi:hypothetical protein